ANDEYVGIDDGDVFQVHTGLLVPVHPEVIFEGVSAVAEVFKVDGASIALMGQPFHPQNGFARFQAQVVLHFVVGQGGIETDVGVPQGQPEVVFQQGKDVDRQVQSEQALADL